MRDRFMQGLAAGAIGWVPQAIFTLSMYGLHLTKLRYMDFTGVLAFSHKPLGIWESLLAESIVVIFQAVLGAVFALFIKVISSDNIIIKAGLWGGAAQFTIYTITVLYQIKGLYPISAGTAAINLLSSLIYGSTMGGALLFLNKRYGVKN